MKTLITYLDIMFIAHRNDIDHGTFEPLLQFENKKIWVNDNAPYLVSNICTHQNSLISLTNGRGNRVCPYHGWSFNIKGDPISSGKTSYCKNDKKLESIPLYVENGLVLTSPVNLEHIFKDINLENLELVEKRIDYVKASSNIIVDLFLDVEHIPLIHKGVYDKIGISNIPNNLKWEYYNWGNIQVVSQDDKIAALWIAIYPNTMIEYQKGALFVTVAVDTNTGSNVIVYKYKDKNFNDLWSLNESVWETAWKQDRAQSEIITSFSQSNLEESKNHFRNWLKINE
jgi:phenylpropionate dioxygenase-like ring-hydroxylating dioxygenase large terminal subunit